MNKRPISVTIIGCIFIAFNLIALVTSLMPLVDADDSRRIAELKTHGIIWIVRTLGILCGVFMLYGLNWARWLLVAWIVYHIILSLLHSLFQLLVHSLLFSIVLYFVFRPQASVYFQGTRRGS